jgi:mRNA-degrading endonuclease RelE of RelBE toxin-antitoxin system
MTYKLSFGSNAMKERSNLDNNIKIAFKKKIEERLKHPEIPSALIDSQNHIYKI